MLLAGVTANPSTARGTNRDRSLVDEIDSIRQQVFEAAAHLTRAYATFDRLRRQYLAPEAQARVSVRNFVVRVRLGDSEVGWLARSPQFQEAAAEEYAGLAFFSSPAFQEGLGRIRSEDPSDAEWGLAVLEADPWCFDSGYMKARISRALRNRALNPMQVERVRAAILNNLHKGRRLEFNETRRLARRVDSPEFRNAIERYLRHSDPDTRERAAMLLESCRMNETRGDMRGAR